MMSHLYQDLDLARIYFSAFQPLQKMTFGAPHAPLQREHRLYQADFLLRKYGFHDDEIPLDSRKNLSLHRDPKTAWALLHKSFFPVEVNKASKKTSI